jgi:hypothetical protein
MATFKVGDRVRVTCRYDESIPNSPYWHTNMAKYIGEVGTIIGARVNNHQGWRITFFDNKTWAFDESSLEHEKRKEMNKTELYIHLQKQCDLKVGDTVKVIAKAAPYQFGWQCPWNGSMDEFVGTEVVISEICPTKGYQSTRGYWWFPFFVLEKVEKPESYLIKLTEDYDALVYKDKIVVGCQTIPIGKFKELQEALKKHE